MNVIRRWTTLAVILALAGCGGPADLSGGRIATVPARGKVVLANGQPLTGGIITLEPLAEGGSTNQAVGEIQSDGRFELKSSESATGAMPGKYRVKVETGAAKVKLKSGQEPEVEVKDGEELMVKLP